MPPLPLPGLNCCRVAASPSHQLSHHAWQIVGDATSVLRPLMMRRYENVLDRNKHRRQQGLHVLIVGNTLGKGTKRVVRNWARRRVEHAIFEQLRLNGFDRLGRSFQKSERARAVSQTSSRSAQNSYNVTPTAANLTGTITVHLLDRILDTAWVDLQQQAKVIVHEVLRRGVCRP